MRVFIKLPNHRRFAVPIPLPMFLFRIALSSFVKNQIINHCDNNTRKYLENIDFEALYSSLSELKNYRGLKLVEVSQKNGTEITVIA